MEPPHIYLGGAEECHSSESGWTMYIGSPIDHHEEGNCDDEDNLGCCYDQGTTQADPEVESDDSMASDASSGPSHYGVNPLTHLQQKVVEAEHDEDEYYSDRKKASKEKEKQVAEKKGEKKHMIFRNSKSKEDPVQGSGKVKVRKNHWVETRK